MLKLRPYQDAAVNHTIPALWKRGVRRVLLCIPVGGGKTVCDAALVQRALSKNFGAVYIIAHTGELLGQQVGGLESVGARWAYVRAGHLGDQTAPVQVCSSATRVRRRIVPPLDGEGRPYRRCIVIVDEGHRVRSATLAAILAGLYEVYEFVYVVVQTGTPYRTDGRGMADACDVLVEATTPRELVANGWLCDPVFYSRPIYDTPDGPPPAGGGAGDEAGDDDEDDDMRGVADFSAQSSKLCGDVVREWKRLGEGAPTVLRAVNRHHAQSLAERFRAAGVRAATIGGDTPHAQRELLYGGLAIGGAGSSHPLALDVLCTGGTLLSEGYDSASSYRHVVARRELWDADGPAPYVPLENMVDCLGGNSRGAWIQLVGRVDRVFGDAQVADFAARSLRASPKRRARVLSHAGGLERHGFLLQHEGFTLTADRTGAAPVRSSAYPSYRPPRVAECPACFASVPAGHSCPACGAASPEGSRELPREDAGAELERRDLTEHTPRVATDDDKERYLHALWRKWRDRCAAGQSTRPEWVGAAFRGKFGHWPDWGMSRAVGRIYGYAG